MRLVFSFSVKLIKCKFHQIWPKQEELSLPIPRKIDEEIPKFFTKMPRYKP